MKEFPILFNTEMVRAILEGRKTQTRRVVKPQFDYANKLPYGQRHRWEIYKETYKAPGLELRHYEIFDIIECPYGQPGDVLWVRETWNVVSVPDGTTARKSVPVYRADDPKGLLVPNKWRPSIHMPRWASRIKLLVKGVRVERVQDISEEDAIAEGIRELDYWPDFFWETKPFYRYGLEKLALGVMDTNAVDAFRRRLWNPIYAVPKPIRVNGKIDHYESFPWDDIQETREYSGKPWLVYGNPWVWVVEYQVLS